MKRIVPFAFVLAAGCYDSTVEVGDLERVLSVPAYPNHEVDLLFVVDNSPSMLDKQQAMIASFQHMMDALATLDGGMPSLHIGVVTSDMGAMGSQDSVPGTGFPGQVGGCQGVGDDGLLQHAADELGGALFIEDLANADGSRTRNYTGELRDVFAKIASVGASGCGFEQHLASMRRGLTNPANVGFLRPEANLAVVIVADEDDCSMTHSSLLDTNNPALGDLESFRCTRFGVTCDDGGATDFDMNTLGAKTKCHASASTNYVEDIQPFVDFLVNLKGDPRAVMVGVIGGTLDPFTIEERTGNGDGVDHVALAHSCTWADIDGQMAVADPAIRLNELAAAFPGRGAFRTVCDADLSLSLEAIGYTTSNLLGSACVNTALADTNVAPGVQPSCDVRDGDDAVPQCDATHVGHCWRMVDDANCTGSPDQLRFEIDRPSTPTAQQYADVRCIVAH